MATGLILVGIGAERLLNAYLGDQWNLLSTSFLSGALSAAVGGTILGGIVYLYARPKTPRRGSGRSQ